MPGWILGYPTGSRQEAKEGTIVHTDVERLAEKTIERQFLSEMETDFELAPCYYPTPDQVVPDFES